MHKHSSSHCLRHPPAPLTLFIVFICRFMLLRSLWRLTAPPRSLVCGNAVRESCAGHAVQRLMHSSRIWGTCNAASILRTPTACKESSAIAWNARNS